MLDGTHMDGDWWVFMTIFWLVLVVIIAWALVTLTRRDEEDRREPREEPPQDRLDRRLADGEIDVETYDDLSRRLRHGRDTIGAET